MILGHVQCRQGQKALELFEKMQQVGVQPDSGTFVGVMNACASILVLKRAGVYISRLLNLDGIQICLCGG
jgi:pentatricopeptide repeat protein